MKLFEKEFIWNRADHDHPDGTLLMTRYKFLAGKWGWIGLHVFHNSDVGRDLHDHPWAFTSLILWGGYYEVRPVKEIRAMILDGALADGYRPSRESVQETVWYGPGSLLHRPARWCHRVEVQGTLVGTKWSDGSHTITATKKKSVSLIITHGYERTWGFYTEGGWVRWKEYHAVD